MSMPAARIASMARVSASFHARPTRPASASPETASIAARSCTEISRHVASLTTTYQVVL